MTPESSISAVLPTEASSTVGLLANEKKYTLPKSIPVPATGYSMGKPVYRGYTLPEDALTALKKLADAGCYKCQGTGIHSYRAHGLRARVCKCALSKPLDAQHEALKPLFEEK